MVGEVEELRPELEVRALTRLEHLEDRETKIVEARPGRLACTDKGRPYKLRAVP